MGEEAVDMGGTGREGRSDNPALHSERAGSQGKILSGQVIGSGFSC